ncbi:MAG: hypothetical protein P4L82_05640, partial [Ancalomicrobiaceae bacterium]|nr:hypothetical protein [Ancalomicrobiaceae bacterium]
MAEISMGSIARQQSQWWSVSPRRLRSSLLASTCMAAGVLLGSAVGLPNYEQAVAADTATWTSGGTGTQTDFNDATNYNNNTPATPPDGNDVVIVAAPNDPTTTVAVTVNSLTLSSGTLTVANGDAIAVTTSYQQQGGTLIGANAAGDVLADTVTISGGTVDATATISATTSYTLSGATGATIDGVLTGPAGLAVSGSGTFLVGGTNTYAGATTIDNGTLLAGANAVLSSASATTVNSTGTLDLGGFSETVAAGITVAGGTLTNGTLTGTAVTATSGTVSSLAGDMTLAVTTGSTTISGSNSYTGTTTIGTGGTLLAGANAVLSSASATTVNATGTLDLGG